MPKWTPDQMMAINEDGQNIIVSAGAGSGKTAVLSERVLTKIQNGVDIDRLLILTFTKAAASEMKDRIRKKIKKDPNLKEQLNKLDNSYITTFDSFSLSLVKKYHYLLNVKKDVNIIESNLLDLKTKEILDKIMEDKYQERNPDFVKLITDFCIKDDTLLKEYILNISHILDMKYDKDNYLNNYINIFYSDNKIEENFKKYESDLLNQIKRLNNLLEDFSLITDSDYYDKISVMLKPLTNSLNYQEIRENILKIGRFPNLPKGSLDDVKKIKTKISDLVKDMTSKTFKDYDELINGVKLTKPYLMEIIDIIKRLDKEINDYKRKNDLYDFVDIAKMAISVIKDNADIQKETKEFFLEIMVDEYQDTSDLQEELISLISNNNLYMVGDIKQSIYRFRNANPSIFQNKYNNYAKHINGMKIDLLKNFRSRSEVLQNINLLFDFLMSDNIGGADYQKEHRMVFGMEDYSTSFQTKHDNNLEIYNYTYDKKSGFKEDEIEAFIIANDILDKVNNHYEVYDKELNILREVRYSDFCVLIDRGKNFELYNKIFLYKKIPLSIYKDEYLTDSNLFSVIKNIYKLILLLKNKVQNKETEYAFLSIGRSFLFNYDDNYLFKVIKDESYLETDIYKKINLLLVNISSKSIAMLLDEIIDIFNFYDKLREIPGLSDNYVKLDYLYTLASSLNNMGYGYDDFINYLEDIIDNKKEIKFSLNRESENSAKIMTIHKSKGLEFPICYFPGLNKKFNDQELKKSILYNQELGIITPYFDEGIDDNFYKDLYKKDYYQEEVSERIRLFYVALTRAREKMILVLPMEEKEEIYDNNGLIDTDIRINIRKFSDMINYLKSKLEVYIKNIDIEKIGLTKDYNLVNQKNIFSNLSNKVEKIKIIDLPKIEMKKEEESHFSKSSLKLVSKKEKQTMEFGTMMHYYLETLDLKNPDYSGIPIDYVNKIKSFLNSDLVKDIVNANIYQEYEFMYQIDNQIMHGIIDLMIEYENYIDIIDYKLKNIDDDAYIKQLSGYKDYISKMKKKDVNIYLYSVMDEKYKKL